MGSAIGASDSLARPPGPALAPGVLISLVASTAVLIFMVDLLTPLGVADGMLYGLAIATFHWGGRPKWAVLAAAGCSILILAGYVLSPEAVGPHWAVLLNRGMSLVVVWFLALGAIGWSGWGRHQERASQTRHSAVGPVRVLRGMLPICASCKRIRDPEARWHQMEVYIRDHSEAQFSHGLCDDCLALTMPEDG